MQYIINTKAYNQSQFQESAPMKVIKGMPEKKGQTAVARGDMQNVGRVLYVS